MPDTEIPQDVWNAADSVGEAIYGRHERGWISWPLITESGPPPRTIVARALMASRAPDPSRDGLVERAAVEKMLRDWQARMDAAGLVGEYNQGTVLLSRLDALAATPNHPEPGADHDRD